MTTASSTPDQNVDVLIAGGGGAGLTASMLLTQLGVDHLLVSALPTTSTLPKAHVLNQRTMEILEDAGVANAIAAAQHAGRAHGGHRLLRGPHRARPRTTGGASRASSAGAPVAWTSSGAPRAHGIS